MNLKKELEQISHPREQSNLVAATSILAGLELEEQTIGQLMRSPVMRESTMRQSILREGRTAGEKVLILRLLTRNLGNVSLEVTAKVSAMSLERLEALGEALLDFTNVADLETWLE